MPRFALIGDPKGLEIELNRPVGPSSEIAGGRNGREGDRKADQVFSPRAGVKHRVYELARISDSSSGRAVLLSVPISLPNSMCIITQLPLSSSLLPLGILTPA